MGSKSKSSQSQSQSTVQTDNRIGASDNAIVGTSGARIGSTETTLSAGGDLSISSLDPETIKGAFGLTDNVVNKLSELTGNATRDSQNLVERIAGETTGAIERLSGDFGRQVGSLGLTQATGGAAQSNKIILAILAVLGLLGGLFLWKRKA
jgi:LPXTG-motif cell wall-anchored protein